MRPPNKDAGFTLVEMLIALFIFSLISVGTMTALTNSIRGKAQVEDRLEEIQSVENARTLLKADFSNLVLRPMRDAYGGTKANMLEGGVDTLVEFTRVGRTNPGGLERRGDIQRVSYVFENGSLIRRSLMQENPAPQTKTLDRILLKDLNTVQMGFVMDDLTARQIFVPIDNPETALKGIELAIEFDNGQRLTQIFELSL